MWVRHRSWRELDPYLSLRLQGINWQLATAQVRNAECGDVPCELIDRAALGVIPILPLLFGLYECAQVAQQP